MGWLAFSNGEPPRFFSGKEKNPMTDEQVELLLLKELKRVTYWDVNILGVLGYPTHRGVGHLPPKMKYCPWSRPRFHP
jgi:hypothetical protein